MKLFKKLAILGMALTLAIGTGAALTACGGDGDGTSTSSSAQTTTYTFKVLNADDTPAVGYQVQLCITDGSCIAGIPVETDGTCEYEVDGSVSYSIHVWTLDNSTEMEFTGLKTIPANYTGGEISLKLKD